MEKTLVICFRADKVKCGKCPHAIPHEPISYNEDSCTTTWEECGKCHAMVHCSRVKVEAANADR